jgi:hypothetical protein
MKLNRRRLPVLLASFCCTVAWAGGHESPGKVLVVGATGETGKLVVPRLLERGYAVRAFVRDAVKGRKLLGGNVELATGDIRMPATIAPAMGRKPPGEGGLRGREEPG